MTTDELKDKLMGTLEGEGVLDRLRSQVRGHVVQQLRRQGRDVFGASREFEAQRSREVSDEVKMWRKVANSLVAEHLKANRLDVSLSVFLPEAGHGNGEVFSGGDLSTMLRVSRAEGADSLLQSLSMRTVFSVPVHSGVQTDESVEFSSAYDGSYDATLRLEGTLRALDEKYAFRKGRLLAGSGSEGFSLEGRSLEDVIEDKVAQYRAECDERAAAEVERRVAIVREAEAEEVRMRLTAEYRDRWNERQGELERLHAAKLEALRRREKEFEEATLRRLDEVDREEERGAAAVRAAEAGAKRRVEEAEAVAERMAATSRREHERLSEREGLVLERERVMMAKEEAAEVRADAILKSARLAAEKERAMVLASLNAERATLDAERGRNRGELAQAAQDRRDLAKLRALEEELRGMMIGSREASLIRERMRERGYPDVELLEVDDGIPRGENDGAYLSELKARYKAVKQLAEERGAEIESLKKTVEEYKKGLKALEEASARAREQAAMQYEMDRQVSSFYMQQLARQQGQEQMADMQQFYDYVAKMSGHDVRPRAEAAGEGSKASVATGGMQTAAPIPPPSPSAAAAVAAVASAQKRKGRRSPDPVLSDSPDSDNVFSESEDDAKAAGKQVAPTYTKPTPRSGGGGATPAAPAAPRSALKSPLKQPQEKQQTVTMKEPPKSPRTPREVPPSPRTQKDALAEMTPRPSAAPAAPPTRTPKSKELSPRRMALLNVFKAIDKEGNHRVTVEDLWAGLLEDGRLALVLKLPAEPTHAEVEARFAQLDVDGNGLLTFDEFCAVLDLPEPVRPRREADRLMTQYDADNAETALAHSSTDSDEAEAKARAKVEANTRAEAEAKARTEEALAREKEREAAAVRIQASVRGRRARVEYERKQQASVRIQAAERGRRGRAAAREARAERAGDNVQISEYEVGGVRSGSSEESQVMSDTDNFVMSNSSDMSVGGAGLEPSVQFGMGEDSEIAEDIQMEESIAEDSEAW